jgi:hypothetical protein
MNELSKYTTIELVKFISDLEVKHNNLKNDMINTSIEVEDMKNTINQKLELINQKLIELKEIEDNYVILVDEYSNR